MYYNKAIFDKYGLEVPTTYDEYVQVCDTLKENGVTPVALASTADDAWLVSQYIQQLSDGIKGEDLFNSLKDGTGKWNDEGMVEAGKLFQEEVNKDILKMDLPEYQEKRHSYNLQMDRQQCTLTDAGKFPIWIRKKMLQKQKILVVS